MLEDEVVVVVVFIEPLMGGMGCCSCRSRNASLESRGRQE